MFETEPPDPSGVVLKKNRMFLSRLVRWLRQNKPIYGGPLRQVGNGFVVDDPDLSSVTGHQFAPTITKAEGEANKLSISEGYLYAPKETQSSPTWQVAERAFWPWLPKIDGDFINADPAPKLTLPSGQTSRVYLKVPYTERESPIGDTDIFTPSIGKGTYVRALNTTNGVIVLSTELSSPDDHSHTISSDAGHEHDGQILLAQLSYHVSASVPPEFVVVDADADDPADSVNDDTESQNHILFGEYNIDGQGIIEAQTWYMRGPIFVNPPTYIKSTHSGDINANPSTAP